MLIYLLLAIGFGLLILVSITTGIFGLVKKRKGFLITAGVLFVIGVFGGAFSAFTYAKKAIDYVNSNEFQDDTKKGAELIGETVGSISSGASNGLANTLDDEAINNLARKSAIIIGKSIKTVASGFDSTIGSKNIFLDNSLADSGIEPGRADEKYNSTTSDLAIFIDYKKDFNGKLRVTNYDQTGKKIEVVEKEIHAKAGQGKVELFSFSFSDLGLTTYYIISKGD